MRGTALRSASRVVLGVRIVLGVSAVLGVWALLAVFLSGTVAWAFAEDRHLTVASATATLGDDAGGHPLFTASTDLGPGAPRTSCISIGASDAAPDDEVRLLAQDITGTIADDLALEVYVGTGGGFGDCTGFSGTQFYHGTVEALAAVAGDGVRSGWLPGSSSVRTFKFVVTLADVPGDQGQTAGATFVWRLETASRPVPPTPATTPTPTPTPTGGPIGSSGTSTTVPTDSTSLTATPLPTGTGPGTGTGAGGAAGNGSGRHDGPTDLKLIPSVRAKVSRMVIGVLTTPQFLFGPLLVALAFVAVQHRIDRRDPKLAKAFRTRRELYVQFPSHYRPEVNP